MQIAIERGQKSAPKQVPNPPNKKKAFESEYRKLTKKIATLKKDKDQLH